MAPSCVHRPHGPQSLLHDDRIPIQSIDEPLYEIVNGERVDLPPMSIRANTVAGELFIEMHLHLRSHRLGRATMEALFILDEEDNTRRRPDVALVTAERWPLDRPIPETGDWNVVPDVAIEIADSEVTFSDVFGKIGEYFAYGVREAWLVIPEERQVYVYSSPTQVRILTSEQSLESTLLPGLSIPLAGVFARTAGAQVV